MSCTEIYGFDHAGDAYLYGSVQNSWRGGMAIWRILEDKYLPPYIPDYVKYCYWYYEGMLYDLLVEKNGFKPTRLTSPEDKALEEIWNLYHNEKVPFAERIVLGTTFDYVVVKKEDIPTVADAFDAFGGDTNLGEQAVILRDMYKDDNCLAVAWNQTSVNGSTWANFGRYDEKTEEDIPYNILGKLRTLPSVELPVFEAQDKHWFLQVESINCEKKR